MYVIVPVPPATSDLVTHLPGVVSTVVQDGPWKVFCGGLPTYLSDDQVQYRHTSVLGIGQSL